MNDLLWSNPARPAASGVSLLLCQGMFRRMPSCKS